MKRLMILFTIPANLPSAHSSRSALRRSRDIETDVMRTFRDTPWFRMLRGHEDTKEPLFGED